MTTQSKPIRKINLDPSGLASVRCGTAAPAAAPSCAIPATNLISEDLREHATICLTLCCQNIQKQLPTFACMHCTQNDMSHMVTVGSNVVFEKMQPLMLAAKNWRPLLEGTRFGHRTISRRHVLDLAMSTTHSLNTERVSKV